MATVADGGPMLGKHWLPDCFAEVRIPEEIGPESGIHVARRDLLDKTPQLF